jgi:hypothetical protein
MPDQESDDEFLNRVYGVDHAESVRPSDADPAKPPAECPACGSPDVRPVRKLPAYTLFLLLTFGIGFGVDQVLAAFLLAIAGSVFFLIGPRWQCASCGNRWS